jgi:hypothetical protein
VGEESEADMAQGEVIRMADFQNPWKQVWAFDSEASSLQVYVNERTGEAEIVQMNDDNECIRTPLNSIDKQLLACALSATKAEAK